MTGFTIDSIKLFLSWEELGGFDFNTFKKKLKNIKSSKKYYKQGTNFIIWTSGFYENFKIDYSESQGIYLCGSISNYYKGYSSLLNYSEFKQSIEKLGSELNLCLHNARLYRIDLALNIITDNPIEHYSHYLFSDLSKYKRLEQDKGVLFKTVSKAFSIYNKSLQLKEKRDLNTTNILRFEFRLLKGVSNFFDIKKMKVIDLYDSNTFLKLLYGFQKTYNAIEKMRVPKGFSELNNITPTILCSWIKIKNVIIEFGGETEFYRIIEQAGLQGKFKNSNDKSRSRRVIRNLFNNEQITEPHPLTLEIKTKIEKEIKIFEINITNRKSML